MKKNLLFIFILLFLLLSPFIGENGFNVSKNILFQIRIPETLTAFITGASLSLAGLIFQSMFRNSLATPYTLGISSGAGFGAAIAVKFSLFSAFLGFSRITFFAFIGAMLSLFAIRTIALIKKNYSMHTLLLSGIAVNFTFSSFTMFIQFIADKSESSSIIHWLMGSIESIGFSDFLIILPFLFLSLIIFLRYSRESDMISFSENTAFGMGVEVFKVRKTMIFFASILTASVVSITGPIGFVGMVIPHITKRLFSNKHLILIPISLFLGGAFLVFCDLISRTIIFPSRIPVGVITALLGGPFFLWIIIKTDEN